MASRKIEIEIIGNSRSLEHALGRATGRSNVFGKALKALAAVGVGAVVVGLHQSVKAALDAEESQSRLQQSFKNSHLSLSRYTKSLESTEKASRALGFGDNDVRESLGSLLTATGSYRKALDLLATAQDVARFKHIDLTAATKLLVSAQTGSQRSIKALGLQIIPVTKNVDALKKAHSELSKAEQEATAGAYKHQLAQAKLQDKLATGEAVIASVTRKTHGMAEAYGKTAAGNIEHFKAEFEHLKAELGRGLLPILSAGTTKLTGFVTSFETHIPELRAQFGGLASAVGAAGKQLVTFGSSRVGQSAIAGLATTFVGSGLVGEVGSFIDLLKTMNPVLIAAGVASGLLGSALYAIITSTSGLTLELTRAKQAIENLKSAEEGLVQSKLNLRVATHQLTGAQLGLAQAHKATKAAADEYGRGSAQHKQALNAEKQAADNVAQAKLNLKNRNKELGASVAGVTQKSREQRAALEALHKRAENLAHQYDATTGRAKAFSAAARASAQAATGFNSTLQAKAASDYAGAIGAITRAMGGTKKEAREAEKATLALAIALGRLPTRKEINIIVTEQRRSSALGRSGRSGRGGGSTNRAAGGRVTGGITGQDSVPSLLMPGEVVYNPRDPSQGLQALAEEGIGPWQRMARGGRSRRHRGGRRPNERRAERRERAREQVPTFIEQAIANARLKHDKQAELAALKRKESWLKRHISITRDAENRLNLTNELIGVQDEIASLEAEGTTSAEPSADLQAQLDQANARLGVANASAALANAFVSTGVFGGGGRGGGGGGGQMPGFGFYELGDSRMLGRAAGAIAKGFGLQGHRPATSARTGY